MVEDSQIFVVKGSSTHRRENLGKYVDGKDKQIVVVKGRGILRRKS